jgi:hypothetical protein
MPHSTGVSWVDALLGAREPAAQSGGERSTEDWIRHLQVMNPGAEDAFHAAKAARGIADTGKTGFLRNLNLRDAEHALFSRQLLEQYGPVLGRLMVATAVPGYSANKVIQQTYPSIGGLARFLSGMDLRQASPPDLQELYWGLRPLFGAFGAARGPEGPAGRLNTSGRASGEAD